VGKLGHGGYMGQSTRLFFLIAMIIGASATFPGNAIGQSTFYASSGAFDSIAKIDPNGTSTYFASGLHSTWGLAFDTHANLYAGGSTLHDNAAIAKIDPNGSAVIFATSNLNGNFAGIAFDLNENLYAAYPGGVYIIDPNGAISKFASLPRLYPNSLAFDTRGNLLVACGSSIKEISPGGIVSTFIEGLDAAGHGAQSIALDANDYVYYSDFMANTICRISPAGAITTYASVSAPQWLAFDGSGALLVSSLATRTVSRVLPSGDVTTVAADIDVTELADPSVRLPVPEPETLVISLACFLGVVIRRALYRKRLDWLSQ
jgi:sugar lactone lactonase YvrE